MELPVHTGKKSPLPLVIFINYWCSLISPVSRRGRGSTATAAEIMEDNILTGLSPDDTSAVEQTLQHLHNIEILKRAHTHMHKHTCHGILTDGNFLPWRSVDCHCAPFPAKSEPAEPATHVPLGGPSVILSPAAGRLGGCEVRRRVSGSSPDVRRGLPLLRVYQTWPERVTAAVFTEYCY